MTVQASILILSILGFGAFAAAYALAKSPPVDFDLGDETELTPDQKAFIASHWDVKR